MWVGCTQGQDRSVHSEDRGKGGISGEVWLYFQRIGQAVYQCLSTAAKRYSCGAKEASILSLVQYRLHVGDLGFQIAFLDYY